MPTISAVILDMDGTLVDSNDAHAKAWEQAITEAGYTTTYDEIRRRMGMGGDNLLPDLLGITKDHPAYKPMSERRKQLFKDQYLPNLKPFPQVRDLLLRFKEDGMRLVIASSASDEELEHLLKLTQAEDLLESTTSASDAENSKPDPDIVNAALQKLELDADEVIMLGDTPYDIDSAGKIRVSVVALRCGGFPDEALQGAIALYDDPADLLVRYDESPFSQRVTFQDER
ncbi:MAG: HAD family hydrolase [bacterium]|nr:HAD family hydrolase [bacterium]